jgi:hypothetical protein
MKLNLNFLSEVCESNIVSKLKNVKRKDLTKDVSVKFSNINY